MTQAFNLAQLANNLNSSGQVDATDGLYGAVPIANGGTGQTTASNAINVLLPSQTGNSGKFLTTNASTASWATITQNFVQASYVTNSTRVSLGSTTADQVIWANFGSVTKSSSSSYLFVNGNLTTWYGENDVSYFKFQLIGGSTYEYTAFGYRSGYSSFASHQHILIRSDAIPAGTYTIKIILSSNSQPNNGGITFNPNSSDQNRFPSGGSTSYLHIFETL